MWKLKYVYRHRGCEYTAEVQRLGISMSWYPISTWIAGKKRHITALLLCSGDQRRIDEFFAYIERISARCERIGERGMLHVRSVRASDEYYDPLYDPRIIFMKPILHKSGLEYTELCCWEKEPLAALLKARRQAEDTEVLDLQQLATTKADNIHIRTLAPSLTSNQQAIFEFARERGYYAHPRKITLEELARLRKMSKSAFHDALRRAESHLFSDQP